MTESAENSFIDADERESLILDHIPLLRHIVGRLSFDNRGSVDKDDLYGFGMLGLIAAADAWDATRGLKFSTFAYAKIRGAILDELRRLDFLPRGRRERVRDVDKVVRTLEHAQGFAPTPEEIADHMGISAEEVDEVLAQARQSAELSIDDESTARVAGMLVDPKSHCPAGSAEWEETRELLTRVITELPSQEQTVITLYYGEELLFKEISDVLGVTESRVSQIHSRAIYRLNRSLSEVLGTP
jgi:RNA polymerase sigma factor FliA